MALPSNIEQQIKEDAQAYAQKNKWIGTLDEVSIYDLVEWDEMAYTKGATEYATKTQKMADFIQELVDFPPPFAKHEMGLWVDKIRYEGTKLLDEWNSKEPK